MAAKKKLEALEDQMRTLALAIDSSYARTGFSPDNIRLNRDFDALEALYNSTTLLSSTQQQKSSSASRTTIMQRTTSTHGHLFSISRKNLIRARAARSSSYFATAASSFIGSPIRQLRQEQQRTTTPQSARRLLLPPNNKPKAKGSRARFLGDNS